MLTNLAGKSKNEQIHRLLFNLLLLVMMVRQICLLFLGNCKLASLLFSMYFLLFLSLAIFSFGERKIYFLHFVVILSLFFIVLFLRGKVLVYREDVIVFALSLFALPTVCYDKKNFYASKTLYSIYVLLTSILLVAGAFRSSNYVSGELVYYTANANQSGIIVLCYFVNMFYICSDDGMKCIWQKLLYNGVLVGLAYAIVRTKSRTVIIAMMIMVLHSVVTRIVRKPLKGVVYAFLFVSLLLPFFINLISRWLGADFLLLGESVLTGREVVWKNAADILLSRPFVTHIGSAVPIDSIAYYGQGLGCHNAFLEISWRYSFVVTGMLFACLLLTIRKIFKETSVATQRKIVPILLASLWHMSFESSLLVGAFDYTLLMLIPVLMILSKERMDFID